MGGGHYTAYGKNKVDGKWYKFNDKNCSEVPEFEVENKDAYILFYVKRSLLHSTPLSNLLPSLNDFHLDQLPNGKKEVVTIDTSFDNNIDVHNDNKDNDNLVLNNSPPSALPSNSIIINDQLIGKESSPSPSPSSPVDSSLPKSKKKHSKKDKPIEGKGKERAKENSSDKENSAQPTVV